MTRLDSIILPSGCNDSDELKYRTANSHGANGVVVQSPNDQGVRSGTELEL